MGESRIEQRRSVRRRSKWIKRSIATLVIGLCLLGYIVYVGHSVDHVPPLKNRYSTFEFWAWLVVTDEEDLPDMSELLYSACDDMTGDPDKIPLIVAFGGDPDWRSEFKGTTSLMYAASHHNEEACLALLQEGADPQLKDDDGKSALDLALSSEEYRPGAREATVRAIRQYLAK